MHSRLMVRRVRLAQRSDAVVLAVVAIGLAGRVNDPHKHTVPKRHQVAAAQVRARRQTVRLSCPMCRTKVEFLIPQSRSAPS